MTIRHEATYSKALCMHARTRAWQAQTCSTPHLALAGTRTNCYYDYYNAGKVDLQCCAMPPHVQCTLLETLSLDHVLTMQYLLHSMHAGKVYQHCSQPGCCVTSYAIWLGTYILSWFRTSTSFGPFFLFVCFLVHLGMHRSPNVTLFPFLGVNYCCCWCPTAWPTPDLVQTVQMPAGQA